METLQPAFTPFFPSGDSKISSNPFILRLHGVSKLRVFEFTAVRDVSIADTGCPGPIPHSIGRSLFIQRLLYLFRVFHKHQVIRVGIVYSAVQVVVYPVQVTQPVAGIVPPVGTRCHIAIQRV